MDYDQNWGLGYIDNGYMSEETLIDADGNIVINNVPNGRVAGRYSDTTETLWEKVSFLAQCLYPYYRADGKMKEQPFIRLRLADMYDVIGYLESLTIDANEFDNAFDLTASAVKGIGNIFFGVKVTMSLSVFHDNEPNSEFYGFYHRHEFDTGDLTTTGPISISGTIKDGTQKNSPLSFNPKTISGNITDTPNVLQSGILNYNNSLSEFKTNFAELNNMGINLDNATRMDKISKATTAYIRTIAISNQLSNNYGLQTTSTGNSLPSDLGSLKGSNVDINSNSSNIITNMQKNGNGNNSNINSPKTLGSIINNKY